MKPILAVAVALMLAGCTGVGLLFKKGEAVRQVPEKDLLRALLAEVAALTGEAVELPGQD